MTDNARLEEIRARVEKRIPEFVVPDDVTYLLTELAALREENARLTKSLAAADAYFPATALEVVNLREENARLRGALEELSEGRGRYSLDRFEHACNTIEDMKALAVAALSPSPAKELTK